MRLALILLILLPQASLALAQVSPSCLEVVRPALDAICDELPLKKGRERTTDLNAQVEAEVGGILKKLLGAKAGVSASSSVVTEEFDNFLREDLPRVQEDATTCRQEMWAVLRDDFCPKVGDVGPAPLDPRAGPDLSTSLLDPRAGPGRSTPDEIIFADPRTQRASDLIDSGRLHEALLLGEEIAATATDPEAIAEGYFSSGVALGFIADANGDALLAERAITYLEKAEATGWVGTPQEQSNAYTAKAFAHLVAGSAQPDLTHLSEAERLAKEALRVNPSYSSAKYIHAVSIIFRGKLTQREDQIREGVSLLRLSRVAAAEQGDTGMVQMVDEILNVICRQGFC